MKTNSPSQARKKLYPAWFPYPTAWLKSFILALFLSIILSVFRITEIVSYLVFRLINNPEILVLFVIATLLSPIIAIAITHHIFHILITKSVPSIQSPEIGNPQGFMPGLISWWEGLFSWLVIALSTLSTIVVMTFILPIFDLNYSNLDYYYYDWYRYYWHNDYWSQYYWYNRNIVFCCVTFWIIFAAILYQIEYLFKRKIIFSYSNNTLKNRYSKNLINGNNNLSSSYCDYSLSNNSEAIDIELNYLRENLGLNQIDAEKESSQVNVPIYPSNQSTQKILSNKLIILPLLFSLVVSGIYVFTNVLPSRELALSPSTISSAPPMVNSSATQIAKPEIDSFQDAVNNALSAAKLTQTAKSRDDWNQVAEQWQKAIALMKSVPSSSTNYAVAQKKAAEYQRNIDYAQAAANNTP